MLPQQARQAFRAYFLARFPRVALRAYAYGVPAPGPGQIPDVTPPAAALAAGKRLWATRFPDGHTYAGCFPDGVRGAAARYPRFDAAQGHVQTLEMALNACRIRNGRPAYPNRAHGPLVDLAAYCTSLSAGYPIRVRLPTPGAVRAFARGERFFWAQRGQRNFSCATCHVQHAGARLGDATLTAALGQAAAFPAYQPATATWISIIGQYRHCLRRMGAIPPPSHSRLYRDLLLYQMFLNNGLPLAPALTSFGSHATE